MRLAPLAFALLLTTIAANAANASTPITLSQAMADPDWIGPPVERVWWRWDGKAAQYTLKRDGATIRDSWEVDIEGGTPKRLDDAARAQLDTAEAQLDAGNARSAFIRNGDVFVRDLHSGALNQLTRSNDSATQLQWGRDGGLVWRIGSDWYRWNGRAVAQAAQLKTEDAPDKSPEADDLRDRQLRLIETLKDDRARRDAARTQNDEWRKLDPTRAPAPVYLGKDVEIADSALSPDGRWVLVVTTRKGAEAGQAGKMPKYVTDSGYEEFEDVRTRVGRGDPVQHTLWLAEVGTGKVRELKFDALPGIATDPLAAMRKAAGKDALKGNRPVRIETDGDGSGPAIHWRDDSRAVALLVRAIDNKDRWIAGVDLAAATLQTRHRLTDPAWINWAFNEFGWLPNGKLWYLSEESGYSHLYTLDGGTRSQLTDGRWETSLVAPVRDGSGFFFLCNRKAPGDYEVCTVDADGGAVREVTALDGVEDFSVSPDGGKLLVQHSSAYMPTQVSVIDAAGSNARQLTDTRTAEFKAREWVQPQLVQVPSKHGAGTIWGKYYAPATLEPGKKYPIVMFVHGAGYLQNVSARYPNYFREQMFHNLLVQQGYIVLDLDYRASEGYGRDWRTAIYRWMGKPELEDYLDGIDWAVANRQVDRDRVGIYGGSYGGFMSLIALMRAPDVFKSGAALRPVTDWTTYNHEYTANILNTPEIDPQAYKISSPIEYAEQLKGNLLIAHGMIDDNVFYQDSVRLSQRLIELKKDNWEMASYPMERHGFVQPEAWYDEYRRIYQLFQRTLK